ncbi:MAG: filamentous hemagglutinin N-terminal domain-containing protein, partial [Betaproteobacteria bacterium]|nr:filamentous hemagglutinin N-terminal domain-containing protein [Betaproteobacteria bacterium]
MRSHAFPKRSALALALAGAFAGTAPSAFANPTGGVVASGSATFSLSGNTLTVTNVPGTIINWQQFSIQKDEITRFLQQNASSSVLNRVVAQNPSLILGQLSSNGRVFLINPSGIVFGAGSTIDVPGFVASTLNITDADFLSGRLRFTGIGTEGSLTNAGTIRTSDGGFIYLIAPQVENQATGVVTSPKGEVVVAAGTSVELVNARTPDLRVQLTAPANQALNAGQIVAASGSVGIYGTLLRNSGLVSAARAEVGDGGKIVLRAIKDVTLDTTSTIDASGGKGGSVQVQADTGTLIAQGEIRATGAEMNGGQIQLLGKQVGVLNANVDASGATGGGSVLIGGDFHGANPDVLNAQRTVVLSSATIRADATQSGQGGNVVVWADGDTRFYGTITARGGALGGDGGNVEVSGKQTLNFAGMVDTTAPKGNTGTLLLDPGELTITNNATVDFNGPSPAGNITANQGTWLFADDPATGNITSGTVNAILANTNVNFQSSGNITIATGADILYSNAPTRNFTLTANESILMNGGANIRSTGGALNITLTADNDGNQIGGIQIGDGSSTARLLSNGGNITLGGAGSAMAWGTSATSGKGVYFNSASVSAGAGNVVIRGHGMDGGSTASGVMLTNTVLQTTSGTISIQGTGGGNGATLADGILIWGSGVPANAS